jgi:hypothetical protein
MHTHVKGAIYKEYNFLWNICTPSNQTCAVIALVFPPSAKEKRVKTTSCLEWSQKASTWKEDLKENLANKSKV